MSQSFNMFSLILLAVTLASTTAAATTEDANSPVYYSHTDIAEFIKTSCKVTLYPKLCDSSLSSYAGPLRPQQSDLVNAAVIISLNNVRNVSVWAAGLEARGAMSKRERTALKDCLENFGDTTDQIRESLAELKRLRRNTFRIQMSNVETWMSAALTNENTCLDGFKDLNAAGKVTAMVTGRVQNVCEFISNALALVNTFAATGGYKELLHV